MFEKNYRGLWSYKMESILDFSTSTCMHYFTRYWCKLIHPTLTCLVSVKTILKLILHLWPNKLAYTGFLKQLPQFSLALSKISTSIPFWIWDLFKRTPIVNTAPHTNYTAATFYNFENCNFRAKIGELHCSDLYWLHVYNLSLWFDNYFNFY